MSDTEQMLFETCQIIEGANMLGLLSVETEAWYSQRKLESELAETEGERRVDRVLAVDD